MNTGAVVGTVGTVIVTALTLIGGWFVKRGDRNAKLTQRYFDDAEYNMELVGALRHDYWDLFAWARGTAVKWDQLMAGLPRVCSGDGAAVAQLMREVGHLPEIPAPKHAELERWHANRRTMTKPGADDEGGK